MAKPTQTLSSKIQSNFPQPKRLDFKIPTPIPKATDKIRPTPSPPRLVMLKPKVPSPP